MTTGQTFVAKRVWVEVHICLDTNKSWSRRFRDATSKWEWKFDDDENWIAEEDAHGQNVIDVEEQCQGSHTENPTIQLLFPTLEHRTQGCRERNPAADEPSPPWSNGGSPQSLHANWGAPQSLHIKVLPNLVVSAIAYQTPSAVTFSDSLLLDHVVGRVSLRNGAYAVVLCHQEAFFRALHVPPARMGEAAGHACLAAQHAVLFAGELCVGSCGEVVGWTNVSGTYQIPEIFAQQSGLPMELFWRFLTNTEARLHEVGGVAHVAPRNCSLAPSVHSRPER